MTPKNRTIHIIDDDPSVLKSVSRAVSFLGYKTSVSPAFAGVSAVAKIAPAAVLLDVFLLEQDGRDVVRMLKAADATRHIPVIMFSAHPDVAAECRAAGADDFLSKPFGLADLEDTLAAWTKKPKRPAESAT